MRNLKFPEIDKKVQQSIYGAWGGSNSNDPNPPPNGGWYDNGDGITIIGTGGGGGGGGGGYSGGGSTGSWGDNGSYDNGGYWGDYGGGGNGAADHDYGENFINPNSMLNYAYGISNPEENYEIDGKIRSAISATGLAAGFTGTAIEAIKAITQEVGFSAKAFGAVGTKIGAAGVVIGGVDVVIAITDDQHVWNEADTVNLIATSLGAAALFFPPSAIVLGGLSLMVGLVGTAYTSSN